MTDFALADSDAAMMAARLLADAGSRDEADLVALSALDLCALGGAEGELFDPEVTRAWRSWGRWKRARARSEVMESLRRRNLLPVSRGDVKQPSALGLVLTALMFPQFVVDCRARSSRRRSFKLYAVGLEDDRIAALVIEQPEARPAGDYPHLVRAAALGWLYSYLLVSPERACAVIARWLMAPTGDEPGGCSRMVALYRPGTNGDVPNIVLSAPSDGSSVEAEFTLAGTHKVKRFDEAELRDLVRDVLTQAAA